jgi:hypothetical protein
MGFGIEFIGVNTMTVAAVGAGVAVAATAATAINGAMSGGSSGAGAAARMNLKDSINQTNQSLASANGAIEPWRNVGFNALANLQQGVIDGGLNTPLTDAQYQASPLYTPMVNSLQDLQNTPGYQFQLQQGLQGVNNSAAANGSLLSGATMKGINDYAQGQASTGYQAAWNRAQQAYQQAFSNNQSSQNQKYNQLQTMANNGQQAAQTQGTNIMNAAGMINGSQTNYATNSGNLALAQGQNNANMIQGIGNGITSGIAQYNTSQNSGSQNSGSYTPYSSSSYQNGLNSLGSASNYGTSALSSAGLL